MLMVYKMPANYKFRFNKRKIYNAAKNRSIRSLGHAGASVRLTARRSIRRSKSASLAGNPVNTRKGLVKRAILYSVNRSRQSALIGPAFSLIGKSAAAHEFGKRYKGDKYPKRPFMGPALLKIKSRLPKFWSVKI